MKPVRHRVLQRLLPPPLFHDESWDRAASFPQFLLGLVYLSVHPAVLYCAKLNPRFQVAVPHLQHQQGVWPQVVWPQGV